MGAESQQLGLPAIGRAVDAQIERQIDASKSQAVFTPTPERLDWARRVCEAFASAGGAAVAVDGQMVDLPVVQRARAVLRSAGLKA